MEEEVDVTLIESWQNLHVVVSHYWNTEDHGKQQEPLRATLYIAECNWECKGSSLSTSENAVLFMPRPKEPKERWQQKNKRTMEKVCTKTYTHDCGALLIAVARWNKSLRGSIWEASMNSLVNAALRFATVVCRELQHGHKNQKRMNEVGRDIAAFTSTLLCYFTNTKNDGSIIKKKQKKLQFWKSSWMSMCACALLSPKSKDWPQQRFKDSHRPSGTEFPPCLRALFVRFLDEIPPCSWNVRTTWTPRMCLVASLCRWRRAVRFVHASEAF